MHRFYLPSFSLTYLSYPQSSVLDKATTLLAAILRRHYLSMMLSSTLGDKSPVYFWKETEKTYGFLSQWYIAPFNAPISAIDSSPICFQSAEQYMMYQKAILFGDYKIADQILGAAKPGLQKSLGRKVQGFDEALWEAEKNRIVEEGNWHKFSTEENSGLKRRLLNTGERELVEVTATKAIKLC